jgi:hypothetical protein
VPRKDWAVFENEPYKVNIGILMYCVVEFFEKQFGCLENYKIIHLLRDPVEVAMSEVQKIVNREFYTPAGYASHYRISDTPPINRPFDQRLALQMAAQIQEDQAQFTRRMEQHPNAFRVSYEDLTQNRQANSIPDDAACRLLNFIGVDLSSLTTTLRKTGANPQ